MRGASIVLLLYSLSMVLFGAGEMTHDFFHFLGRLKLSAIHDHEHGHHHSFHDHDHGHVHEALSHHHESEENTNESIPVVVNFFFAQHQPVFAFRNSFLFVVHVDRSQRLLELNHLPPTPPPRK